MMETPTASPRLTLAVSLENKRNGNYYSIIGYILNILWLYWDNEKYNGNYYLRYLGSRNLGFRYQTFWGFGFRRTPPHPVIVTIKDTDHGNCTRALVYY